MPELHEIKIVNIQENIITDTIYIHDDFWGYLGEKNQTKLISNIPVFYPDSLDFDYLAMNDLTFLDKFNKQKPTKKGISITGINIISSFSFEKLLDVAKELKCVAIELDDCTLNNFNSEFSKNETIYNFEKLSAILKDISSNKTDYIILWEGI